MFLAWLHPWQMILPEDGWVREEAQSRNIFIVTEETVRMTSWKKVMSLSQSLKKTPQYQMKQAKQKNTKISTFKKKRAETISTAKKEKIEIFILKVSWSDYLDCSISLWLHVKINHSTAHITWRAGYFQPPNLFPQKKLSSTESEHYIIIKKKPVQKRAQTLFTDLIMQ